MWPSAGQDRMMCADSQKVYIRNKTTYPSFKHAVTYLTSRLQLQLKAVQLKSEEETRVMMKRLREATRREIAESEIVAMKSEKNLWQNHWTPDAQVGRIVQEISSIKSAIPE